MGSNPQVTPIVINGVMYLPARGNQVLALEAETGKEVWRHTFPSGVRTTARGVAYWPGDGRLAPRILLTAGPKLVALDAATGTPSADFGDKGTVEIAVPWNGVPTIYKNVAILGATVGEVTLAEPGDTRAFDVRTGKRLWDFHTVPLPGELGHNTWLDHGWRNRSGVNVWAWYMTLDEERGILYMPIAGPAGNYWGGDRPGNNLFANSIVAVDAETGKYRWHFQTVHHDLWDSDMPNPPVLVDIMQNGRRVPALASVGKTGWMFILDRVTGKPIFGVEERPVPKGSVPGEWSSPTQPFPVKPAKPLVRVDFNKERDMVRPEDTSAEHVAECQALWDKSGGFHNAGAFTPFGFHDEGAAPKSTIQFPGGTGGINWGGATVDPTTGFVYVNAHDTSLVGWIERKRPGLNYVHANPLRERGIRVRRLRLVRDVAARAQLREGQAGVDAAALVEHLVEVAVHEEAPVERHAAADVLHVRADRRRAVVGERRCTSAARASSALTVVEVVEQQRARALARHAQPVEVDLLAAVVGAHADRRRARRPRRSRARTGGRSRATAEYSSPRSLRVSIEIASCWPSSNSQLMIVCAIVGGPQYDRKRSTPTRLREVVACASPSAR